MDRTRRAWRSAVMTIVLLCAILVTAHPAIAAPRAVWIWEEDAFRILDRGKEQQETLSFLEQRHIATMYLYADAFKGRNILVNEPVKYRSLIAAAHARGFKVFALLGSAYLRTEEYVLPEKRSQALSMFRNILDFNKNAPDAAARFDGVNIDIEPYLLDDWSSARPLHARQYLELSAEFMRMKAAYGSTISVGPAMPFWYDGIEVEWNGQRRSLNESVQDIYDYVALMDYRNTAEGRDSMVSLAEEELEYADRVGKKVMIGIETLETTPAKVTFYGKGVAYLESQLALAESAMARHASFGGFVVHHLRSYRALVGETSK